MTSTRRTPTRRSAGRPEAPRPDVPDAPSRRYVTPMAARAASATDDPATTASGGSRSPSRASAPTSGDRCGGERRDAGGRHGRHERRREDADNHRVDAPERRSQPGPRSGGAEHRQCGKDEQRPGQEQGDRPDDSPRDASRPGRRDRPEVCAEREQRPGHRLGKPVPRDERSEAT